MIEQINEKEETSLACVPGYVYGHLLRQVSYAEYQIEWSTTLNP